MSTYTNLYIVFPLWKYVRNGGVKVLIHLSDQANRLGAKSKVIVVGKIPPQHFSLDSPHAELFVPAFLSSLIKHYPRLALIWDLWAALVLFLYFRRTRATHVICNYHLQIYSARAAQLLFRKKFRLIYYIQAYEPDFFPKPSLYQTIRRWLAKKSYVIKTAQLTNSARYHYDEPNISGDPERCVTPGLDLTKFYAQERTNCGKLKIGTLYSPIAAKGSSTALKAFQDLNGRGFPFDLVIGTSYPQFLPTRDFKLSHITSEERLVSFYQALDILVAVPNKQFGAPHLPILEGMACGCALVCTDFFLTRHLVNALVIPPDDAAAIVQAIITLHQNPELRIKLAAGGLETVADLQWEAVGNHFLRILSNLPG